MHLTDYGEWTEIWYKGGPGTIPRLWNRELKAGHIEIELDFKISQIRYCFKCIIGMGSILVKPGENNK